MPYLSAQSRQIAKFFSPVVGIGTPPTPHPQASVPPPRFGSGGRGTLAGERGVGRVPIPTRGHMYTVVLCAFLPASAVHSFALNVHSLYTLTFLDVVERLD